MLPWSGSTRSAPVEGFSEAKKAFGARLLKPPHASSSLCSEISTNTTRSYIYAIDRASTKLRIPLSATEPTQAFKEKILVQGLCRLYLKGCCHQGMHCHQVHANPSVVETLRQETLHAPSCCYIHGAKCNFGSFPLGLTFTLVDDTKETSKSPTSFHNKISRTQSEITEKTEVSPNGVGKSSCPAVGQKSAQEPSDDIVISIHSLCPTNYLWLLYTRNVSSHIYLPKSKICRAHRKELCHFGDQCSFLHVCREISINLSHDSDGMSAFRNPTDSSRLLQPERVDRDSQPNSPEVTYKSDHPRQVDLGDSFNHNSSFGGSSGSFSNYNQWRELASEHACTYSGMLTSKPLCRVSGPLLRPSGPDKSSANPQRHHVFHNPYSLSLQ